MYILSLFLCGVNIKYESFLHFLYIYEYFYIFFCVYA